MPWEVRDVPPSVRRAAEKAAGDAGKPLGDWLAETVRSAATAELGGLPAPATSAPVSVVPAAPARTPPSPRRQLDLFPKSPSPASVPAANASPPPAPADTGPLVLPTAP